MSATMNTYVDVSKMTIANVMDTNTVWICEPEDVDACLLVAFREYLSGSSVSNYDVERRDGLEYDTLSYKDAVVRFIVENAPIETPALYTGEYNVLTPLRWFADTPQRISTIRKAFADEMEKRGYTTNPDSDFIVTDDADMYTRGSTRRTPEVDSAIKKFRTLAYREFKVYYSV